MFLLRLKELLSKLPLIGAYFKGKTVDDEAVSSARMTHNRLQALDGHGYRESYLDKIREAAQVQEAADANKDHWFKGNETGFSIDPDKPEADLNPLANHPRRHTSNLPSQARITSTRLKAYADTLKQQENSIDKVAEADEI
ncbi:MAG TPA: hypothetical protein PKH78_07465 [Candidatus Obscuribacter sp.]|nr:hypothetical protein [Candidatus Obscuribacter sp.]HNN62864.1 hypothetical protein [Candidatus Obscuribacter sp.]